MPNLKANFLNVFQTLFVYKVTKKTTDRTLFFRHQNAIKKQTVIANGGQRNEAICPVLAVVIARFVIPNF